MIQKLNGQPESATAERFQSKLSAWVPMPRYLLRSFVVKRILRSIKADDFIEIGSASGHMAQWMSDKLGMHGTAVEISPSALEMMYERLGNSPTVKIYGKDAKHLDTSAEVLVSTEVLEHIEDDAATLESWFDLIEPGGHLILSVPAHQHMFSEEDEMAGHFRRYSRQELNEKLENAGFENPQMMCYGFPLGLFLKKLRNGVANKKLKTDIRTKQERTEASGVERSQWCSYRWLLNDFFMAPFNWFQLPFMKFDLGDGFIAVAKKPE